MDKDDGHQPNPEPCLQSQPHSPKTLTLETPAADPPDHGPQKPQVVIEYTQIDEGDDRLLPTPKSPHVNPQLYRRGHKGKKAGPKWRGKIFQQKTEALVKTFKPVPFAPAKAVDFSGHEDLLRRLGLWEFVHVSFDGPLRSDLIVQLVATYRKKDRASFVNGVRVRVNRTDLARALKMPVPGRKKERASLGIEVLPEKPENRDSIVFLSDLLSNWVLIHDDTWIMPDNVMSWFNAIQEGRFDCLDWPEIMWFMVEKELMQGTALQNCYYASHLQCLIRSQKEELFREEADAKDEDDDVKMVELEDQSLELSLGHETVDSADVDEKESAAVAEVGAEKEESFCSEKRGEEDESGVGTQEEGNAETGVGKEVEEAENRDEEDNEVKEQGGVVADVMDSEDKEEEEQQGGQWFFDGQNETGRQFLQQCSFNSIGDFGLGYDTDKKAEEEEREEGQEMEEQEVEEEEVDDDDVDEEEQEDEQGGFHMPGNLNYLDGLASANLIQLMDNDQMPFSSGAQIHDDSCGEFLASGSRAGTRRSPGIPPAYMNPNKREIDHNNGLLLNGGPSKRMRTEQLDFNTCSENMLSWFEKMRLAHEEKEQVLADTTMSQQMLINEVQQRGTMIEHLQKVRDEDHQKMQHIIYKLERELVMMTGLLEGYRKALKETNKAFADYRARCPQLDEPLYRDVPGSGGLVLSVTELEKQRLKREEEERMKLLIISDRIKEFEATWKQRFEAILEGAELLSKRLLKVEEQMKGLKELAAKRKLVQEKGEEPVIQEKAEEESAGQEKAEESSDQETTKESADQVMGEVSAQVETEA